jgi:phosphoribosylanthranilate isomerase
MPIRVKVCGITNTDDALGCVAAGVDALGFVFYPGSPRVVSPERARDIIRRLPPFVTTVGVFVDEDAEHMNGVADYCGLDILQLHGDEAPEVCRAARRRVVKAFRVGTRADFPYAAYPVSAYLLDTFVAGTPGGTGVSYDWSLARPAREFGRVILAGGLTPDNVADAIARAQPDGLDVGSGVERSPGHKEMEKVQRFVRIVRGVLSV